MTRLPFANWFVVASCGSSLAVACSLQDFDRLNDGAATSAGKQSRTKGGANGSGVGGAIQVGGSGITDGGEVGGLPNAGAANAGGAGGVGQTVVELGGAGGYGGGGMAGAGVAGDGSGGNASGGASATTSPPRNLMLDPGFETSNVQWAAFGGARVERSMDNCYSGTYCLRTSSRKQSWEGPACNLISLVTLGKAYSILAWVRVSGSAPQSLSLTSKTRCDGVTDENAAFLPMVTVPVTSTWLSLAGVLKVVKPETCTTFIAELAIYVEGAAADVDIFLDDVSVTEVQ